MVDTLLETPPAAPASVACPDCGRALGCVQVLYPGYGYCYGCNDWRPASPEARPAQHPSALARQQLLTRLARLDYQEAERRAHAKGA